MKILFAHNNYQLAGGEEQSFAQEVRLLRNHGHTVIEYTRSNHEVETLGWHGRLTLPGRMVWSRETYRDITTILRQNKPDIAHINNIHFMISPSIFHACVDAGVPSIMTLRNYRLLCPVANFLRDGHVCEACLGKAIAWPGVMYGCWRGSRLQTAIVATTLAVHYGLDTWTKKITRYIALTNFARTKFIEGGLPADKIAVRPNFLDPDPGPGTHTGNFAIFVGRLSPEKGLNTLFEAYPLAANQLDRLPLKIIGEGPLNAVLQKIASEQQFHDIEFPGWQPTDVILSLMQQARLLIFPSIWYEGLPRVLIEAFASGVPVIASNLGSMGELVTDHVTGLLFPPGDVQALASKIVWAWQHPDEMQQMGRNARAEYEQKYTAEVNYTSLMQIYEDALQA